MSGGEEEPTPGIALCCVQNALIRSASLDEVEAALDDTNLSKLIDAIERLKETTQLIISHQRRTMERTNVLATVYLCRRMVSAGALSRGLIRQPEGS